MRAKAEHEVVRHALVAGSAGGLRVVEYTVQSNHLHLLVEVSNHPALSRGMIGLTVRLARGLNRLWRRRGRVFPDRYHARALTSPREVRNALARHDPEFFRTRFGSIFKVSQPELRALWKAVAAANPKLQVPRGGSVR